MSTISLGRLWNRASGSILISVVESGKDTYGWTLSQSASWVPGPGGPLFLFSSATLQTRQSRPIEGIYFSLITGFPTTVDVLVADDAIGI